MISNSLTGFVTSNSRVPDFFSSDIGSAHRFDAELLRSVLLGDQRDLLDGWDRFHLDGDHLKRLPVGYLHFEHDALSALEASLQVLDGAVGNYFSSINNNDTMAR